MKTRNFSETDEERTESEKDFSEWLESIKFVDENGQLLPEELTEDTSDDPENDRGE